MVIRYAFLVTMTAASVWAAIVMVREADDARALASLLADERKNAVLIGPGIGVGERTKELVRSALASKAAVVLDADAITSFADDAKQLFTAIKSREAPVVMTPHGTARHRPACLGHRRLAARF